MTGAQARQKGTDFAIIHKQGHSKAAADFYKAAQMTAAKFSDSEYLMSEFHDAAMRKSKDLEGMMWSDRLGFVSIPED